MEADLQRDALDDLFAAKPESFNVAPRSEAVISVCKPSEEFQSQSCTKACNPT